MVILLSLEPLIINPLEIYNYNKVILNDSMYNIDSCISRISIYNYFHKIFDTYNKQYYKSFKYFVKICENIEFQFINFYNDKVIMSFISCILNYIICYCSYNKDIIKIFIYVIKKYKSFKNFSYENYNIIYNCNPVNTNYKKISFKLYKYILSLNLYYKEYSCYETQDNNIILDKQDLLIIKIKNQQETWRCRRLFILLCL